MTTGRFSRVIPLVLVLLAWATLGSLHVFIQNNGPRPRPLPPLRRVVVLLVPGLDAGDWNHAQTSPVLSELVWSCPAAIAPVPAPLRRPHADSLSPNSRLLLTCETVLGKTNWGQLLRDAKGRAVVLDASGVAAPLVFGGGETTSHEVPPVTWHVSAPEAEGGEATDPARFAQAVRAAFALSPSVNPSSAPVLVVAVLDDLFRADVYAPLCSPEAAQKARQAALRRVSDAVYKLTNDGINSPAAPDAVLLVAPLPPDGGKPENERQGLLVLWNAHDPRKALDSLTSPSTRHTPGVATFGDVPQAVASLLDLSPQAAQGIPGRSLEAVSTFGGGAAFARQQKQWAAQWREMRFLVAFPWILAGLLLFSVFWAERKPTLSAVCVLFACAAPVALWMAAAAPLFFGESRAGFVYGLAILFAGGTGATAFLLRRREGFVRALPIVAGFTVFVLALDTVLGGPLLGRSPLSFSPLEGARFYGVGNEASGIFLGAGLFCVGLLPKERVTFWTRLFLGLGMAAVLGLPTLGANTGATVAALAGWGTLLVLDTAPTRRKGAAVLAAVCAVVLLAGLGVWESRRPPSSQTHLGQVIGHKTGGAGGAVTIARRKIAMNAHLAVSSPWAVLLFVEGGLCVCLWRKAKANGTTINQSGAPALFVGAGAAFVANDSGVVMAAACLLFAPPFLLCLTSHGDG